MTRVDLATLLAALDGDRHAAERHRALALELLPRIEEEVVQTAVAASLHHFYSAIESLIERILRGFGQSLPPSDRWHQDLLDAAGLDIPDVRPPILTPSSVVALRRLLAFRHFFRHAYAVVWDPEALERNVGVCRDAWPQIVNDLDAFVAAVRDAIT